MKKFLKRNIFFLVPIILCVFLLEFALRSIPNSYLYKKEYLDENAKEIEIILLGNSHTYNGIDPKHIEVRSFNASHPSQTFDYDLKILEKWEDKLESLEFIVLPISYFSFFYKLEEFSYSMVKYYSIYYDINVEKNLRYNSEVFGDKGYLALYKFYLYYIKGETPVLCSDLGFRSVQGKLNNFQEKGNNVAKSHTIKNFKYYEENVDKLEEIIKFATSKEAKVVLYTPPAYKTYVNNLNEKQLEITIKTANNIEEKHENVKYINFLQDTNFDEMDFYNADHLNQVGAEKLTKLIYDEIINFK